MHIIHTGGGSQWILASTLMYKYGILNIAYDTIVVVTDNIAKHILEKLTSILSL